jgi:hypothetical protein
MVQAEAIQGRDLLSYTVVRLARLERAMEAHRRRCRATRGARSADRR